MKQQSPFKLVSCFDSPEGSTDFEAVFPLPDDGTGPNLLVFRVSMESTNSNECHCTVINRTHRDKALGNFTMRVSDLANALYGFATLKQVPQLIINQ